MRDISGNFGTNAGKIWSALNEKGSLKKEEIITIADLDEYGFDTGIGWLARENKVARVDEQYKLDNTNLEYEIGTYAGKVWKILDTWEDADIESIKLLSNLNDEQVRSALGWLAKEDKIWFNENNRLTLKP